MKKKTLIISYTFPPQNGIGGRRWAKFSKYLFRKNIDISVVAAKYYNTLSPWRKDTFEYEGKIEYLNSGYPKYLGMLPDTILHKIAYRFSLLYAKFKLNGNYYDKSAYWEKKIIKKVIEHILSGTKNVIVTVAPFRTAYYIVKLKEKFPEVNFIVDFRDPWTANKTSYGFEGMSLKRKKQEKYYEKIVLQKFDYIVSVSHVMTDFFYQQSKQIDKSSFITIPNGFDAEDFEIDRVKNKNYNNEKVNLVFTGTFYSKAEHLLITLSKALSKLKKNNNEVYSILEFNFFGSITFNTKEYSSLHPQQFKFHGAIPLNSIYNKIYNSTACLLFLTDDINYSISTKFCEYLYAQKPVVLFSKQGKTGEFINNNNLGFVVDINNMYDSLIVLMEKIKSDKLHFNKAFNLDEYNVKYLANSVERILI